ncbi:unnamed protein product [Rotaria sordida]|uniref:Uncharacterized protein n=1 Tax=Rotaria sordida TaxID=392033 RepID=A0A820AN88_9BILA|nr:unnamed protein product [Rotaria sordida]CAF4194668.1 unnamed protein product [Rotaria sordida]
MIDANQWKDLITSSLSHLNIPQRYWNQFINTFENVTNLTLYHATLKEKTYQYYFSNVASLTILPPDDAHRPALETRARKSLRNITNPSNLKYLGISSKFRIKDSSALLYMLQEFPQLTSLMISIRALEQFGYDTDLCEYLNKTIKTLDIYKYHSSSFKYHY